MRNNMFDNIRNSADLFGVECGSCSENNTAVQFENSLKIGNDLNENLVLILKPDNFYNSNRMANPPPSPDCLILVRCLEKKHYDLYLIELRDVKNSKNLKCVDIEKKFQTMIDQFFVDYEDIFKQVIYGSIKFYLVTSYPSGTGIDFEKKVKGCALDAYSSRKPFKFYNRPVQIEVKPAFITIGSC